MNIAPMLQVFNDKKGVLIKWTLPKKFISLQAFVHMYELYGFIITRDSNEELPSISRWSKVGDVQPLKLPMAVTLTNILKTKNYVFAVRAVFNKGGTLVSEFSKPSYLRDAGTIVIN